MKDRENYLVSLSWRFHQAVYPVFREIPYQRVVALMEVLHDRMGGSMAVTTSVDRAYIFYALLTAILANCLLDNTRMTTGCVLRRLYPRACRCRSCIAFFSLLVVNVSLTISDCLIDPSVFASSTV